MNQVRVRNPRTGELDYFFGPPLPNELRQLAKQARQAQTSWEQAGLAHRIEVLQAWKQVLIEQEAPIVVALTTDTGRLIESQLEFQAVLQTIDRWCRQAPEILVESGIQPASIPFLAFQKMPRCYPLAGIISPWNFPLLLALIDAIPALLAGCATLIKPSEITPRFLIPLTQTIAAVPELAQVLQLVAGTGETGAELVGLVDLVCFTGSVVTGRKVGEAAARHFIPAFLELGGKDPALVLESADLELASSAIVWGSVVNAGQSCLSIERVYVQESVLTEFTHKVVTKARQLTLAYPLPDDGEIGPLIFEKQADVIEEHLQDARAKGATIHCGGTIEQHGGGYWCRPTVLTGVNHSMKIMTEETFGPIIPLMPFRTLEEGIALANDSQYGLSGAVFGSQPEALEIARQLEVGAVSINDAALTAMLHEGEKQAFKLSGLGGPRMGAASLLRFLRQKVALIKTNREPDPWWFKHTN
ncbi:MAG: aldehyde dehydrogenase family protein [Blastocatellia bacterium]|nr:aldehyde dehydrogenase family protein [Blastocatellia bacterium]